MASRAVPIAAAIIADPPVPAVVASFDMTTKRSGATGLDSRHDLELMKAQMSGMVGPVPLAGTAKDVGDLEVRAHGLSRAAMFALSLPSAQ